MIFIELAERREIMNISAAGLCSREGAVRSEIIILGQARHEALRLEIDSRVTN